MNDEVIKLVADEVKDKFKNDGTGHDWWHIYRVWQMALKISEQEKADLYVVQLSALLHDIADWKYHDGDDTVGPKKAREILEKYKVAENVIDQVVEIIADLSFKGAGVETKMKTVEGMIVQDADRLDAIGAIGIARTFAYGGYKNNLMYDPEIKPVIHNTKEEYFKSVSTTINHFYEKLLLLKDLMNTDTAKQIALQRHEFMEEFLKNFYNDVNIKP